MYVDQQTLKSDIHKERDIHFSEADSEASEHWLPCKNILIVVHGYPPRYTGGAEQRAERTARALMKRGFNVRVLCFAQYDNEREDIHWVDSMQHGVAVRQLILGNNKDVTFAESYNNQNIGVAFEKLLQEWRPDLVYLFSGYLMTASIVRVAKIYNLPVVIALTDYWWLCHQINLITSHGDRCEEAEPLACARCLAETYRRFRLPTQYLPFSANWLWNTAKTTPLLKDVLGVQEQRQRSEFLKETLCMADKLISPSQYLADCYIKHGTPATHIHVSRQGVDLTSCPLRIPSSTLRVGYLGQIKPHKGVHLLLEAWSKLSGSRARWLTLYGSHHGDEHYGHLINQSISRLDHAHWAGSFVGSKVWDVLSALDVLVVPSRWVENSPNIIIEAQALGIPIIGTNLGGIAEMVKHEQNGLLFAVDDSDDLARQLQRLLDEPDLLVRLQQQINPFISKEDEIDDLIQQFATVVSPLSLALGAS